MDMIMAITTVQTTIFTRRWFRMTDLQWACEETTVVRRIVKLVERFLPASPMAAGVAGFLRGLRTGDQRALLGGAAMAAFGWWRTQQPSRQLIYRREVPVGSTVVVRHGRKGEMPEIEIHSADSEGRRAGRRRAT